MKKTLTLLFILLVFVSISFAQKPKFKKVTQEELEKTFCEYDENAKAEYLYHGCNIWFEYDQTRERFNIIYDYHERIKIYSEQGIDLADRVLTYYAKEINSTREKISKIEAYTFNLDGGKVVKTKLDKDNVFSETINDYYRSKKFAMPAVKTGSVLEIKYRLTSPYYFKVDEFYFQKDIPVQYTEYEISTPEYFNYNYNLKGLVNLELSEDQTQGKINYSYVTDTSNDPLIVKKTRQNVSIDFLKNIKKYTGSNIVGIKNEPFVYTMDNFRSSIKLELLFTQFPNSAIKYYTKSWNDIIEILDKSDSFGDQLRKNYKEMKPLLSEVESMSDAEKIAAIYSTVQEQFKWDNYTNVNTSKGIKKMIKEGSGNTAEINLLLVNLLQKAGLQAFPMVYKKRSSGYLNITNPTIAELNYVIAIVVQGENVLYLDATDKNLQPGMLPPRALNLKGIAVLGKEGKEIPIINKNKGTENKTYASSYDGDALVGSYKQSVKNYDAYYIRNTYSNAEDYVSQLQNDKILLENTEIKGFENKNDPILITSDINLKGYTQSIDGKIFIDLMVGQKEFKNFFVEEERDFALFFNSKSSETKIIKIEIPEGYQVESIPEPMKISTPDRLITFLIETKVVGKDIVTTIRNKINETIINPQYYPAIKTVYETVEAKTKEKIVLAKI